MVGLRGDGGERIWVGREETCKWDKPLRGFVFKKTISRRLIVSMGLYFHFLSLVLRQNSLSLLVNMNSGVK